MQYFPKNEVRGGNRLKKAIVITGSSGDIGRSLTKAFKLSGWFVIGLDIKYQKKTNTPKKPNDRRITRLIGNKPTSKKLRANRAKITI